MAKPSHKPTIKWVPLSQLLSLAKNVRWHAGRLSEQAQEARTRKYPLKKVSGRLIAMRGNAQGSH